MSQNAFTHTKLNNDFIPEYFQINWIQEMGPGLFVWQEPMSGFMDQFDLWLQKKIVIADHSILNLKIPSVQLNKNTYAPCSAVCLPVYHLYSKTEVDEKIVSVFNSVQRKEKNYLSNHFFNEYYFYQYHVKDWVVMGSEKFVKDHIENIWLQLKELLKIFDLNLNEKKSHDLFFSQGNSETKRIIQLYQKLKQTKLELVYEEMPVASLNYHGSYFVKKNGIRLKNKQAAYTACIGIGLERLLISLMRKYHPFELKHILKLINY